MKRFLIALLVLAMAASALADNPVAKGMLYMDGAWTGNFAIKGGDLNKGGGDDNQTYIQLNPSLGYFLAPGIAIGATVMFESWTWGDYKDNMFGAGPKVMWFPTAKNADDPKGKILPFLAGSFIFGQMTTEMPSFEEDGTDELKTTGYAARFSGGGVWMLTNGFGVHGEAYFELQNEKAKYTPAGGSELEGDGVSGNEFGIMIGVIGFFGTAK